MGEVDDFIWKGGMVLGIFAGGQSRALPLRGWGMQKGDTEETKGRYKGKREKKKETGGIGNHRRKRSFLGKA